MSEFLWVEKYRPKKIRDCILPEDTKKTFTEFLKQKEIPNLLLSGTAGTGKTTVARALCEELGIDIVFNSRSHSFSTSELRKRVYKNDKEQKILEEEERIKDIREYEDQLATDKD